MGSIPRRKGKCTIINKVAYFCLTLALWPAPAAIATQEEPTILTEIIVEGRRIEEHLSAELATYGHKVEIVTAKEIKRGGFTDVNQVLESLVPGLYVSSRGGRGDYARMSLNGGGTNQIVFLLDGIRINNRLYGSGYLDTISTQMIERIEILKNGEGLFYGTDGIAGVINIITKKITQDSHGSIGASVGSYKATDAHGLITDTVNGNGFLFYGSYDGWEGYLPFEDEDYARIEGAAKKERGYGRNTIMAKYQREIDNLGNGALFQGSILRNVVKADFARVNEEMALNDRTEYVGLLKWDHDVTDDFSYYVKGYYHEWWTDYTRQRLDGTFIFNEALWGYEDFGLNIMGSWFFHDQNELLVGFDYQNYWGEDEIWQIAGDTEEVTALFFALRPSFTMLPNLKLSLGGRYNQTGGNDIFVWNVSGRTPVWETAYIRASVGTNFKLASAEQLYLDEPDWGQGNPDLKPEESTNYEVGLGASYGLITAEIGYTHINIVNMIGLGQDRIFTNTEEETTLKNIELQLSSKPFHGFSFVTSASFTDAKTKGSDQQLTKIPENFFKGILRYEHPSKSFGGDVATRYIGKIASGSFYSERYDTYYGENWLTDFSTFYRFGKDLPHMLTLRIDNLFDDDYDTYGHQRATDSTTGESFLSGFRGAPRTITLSYKFTF
jgi:vitamin B12 transporter